ncbi:hypothetical protein RB653_007825 [Dictyostelium firmibasis]|uniref:EGF-like domain-containing protein n=1 Tax=Dictyostelium firmibasis TaxID=79012 RepID=A0AAN7YRW2_9MYCE
MVGLNKLNYLIIILLILVKLKHVFSIQPPPSEFNCISAIKSKFSTSLDLNNLCGTSVTCDPTTGSILTMAIFPGNPNSAPTLLINDLLCLTKLRGIIIQYVPLENGFIYYNFPSLKSLTLKDTMNSLPNGITQTLPNYDYFELSSSEFGGKTLNLLYLVNVKSFKSSISYVKLVCDPIPLGTIFQPSTLVISAINYPNFTNYPDFQTVEMNFDDNFDLTSIVNFATISTKIMLITHNIASSSMTASTEFYGHLNFKISKLYINSRLSTPSVFFNFSKNKNYEYIQIPSMGNFNVNGEFPIINIQKNTSLYISYGTLSNMPPISQWGDVDHNITLTAMTMNTALPNFTGSGQFYKLSGDGLFGTIDKSWCNTEIVVSYNQLTGTIPSCFSCYFNNSEVPGIDFPQGTMFTRFAGNQFTNYNLSIPCTTFYPRVSVLQKFPPIIKMFGQDIGYDPRNWLVNNTIGFSNVKKVLIGREYHLTLESGSFIGVDYFSVLFKLPYNNVYTFPIVEKNPIINKISVISDKALLIEGFFFSSYEGYSSQSISVGGINCLVDSTSFFKIECSALPSSGTFNISTNQVFIINSGYKNSVVFINTNVNSINDKTCPDGCIDFAHGICDMTNGICVCNSQYQGSNCSIPVISCPSNSLNNQCSGNGLCNSLNGECICNSDFQSLDCSIPFVGCPIDSKGRICSNFGTCNNRTGNCYCDSNHQSNDCSIPFIKCSSLNPLLDCSGFGHCDNVTGTCICNEGSFGSECSLHSCSTPKCSSNGICDQSVGKCVCYSNFTGDDCLTPLHYISSIIPSLETGGEASFFGYFGDLHSNISLTIGNLSCKITYNSSNLINCTAPPGKGIKSVSVFQNQIVWNGKDIYQYLNINGFECPNDCSNNGRCNKTTLECECFENFGSFDCSGLINNTPKTNVTIDTNSSSTTIKNQEINFQIYYKRLLEVDFNGNIIKQYLLKDNWISNENKTSSSLDQIEHQFIQSISDGINQFKVVSNIKEITKGYQITFADTILKLKPNSIKLTISIQNYNYQNSLNSLKLEMVASVSEDDEKETNCNQKDSNIDTSNSNDLSMFNFIKISKNNKLFSGRFINRVLSDGKSTFLSSSTIKSPSSDSIIISLNLPHCKKECLVDPDFSLLVTPEFQQKCEKDEGNKKYVIPVAVVVSVVGVATISALAYLIYRKKFVENQLKVQLRVLNKQ